MMMFFIKIILMIIFFIIKCKIILKGSICKNTIILNPLLLCLHNTNKRTHDNKNRNTAKTALWSISVFAVSQSVVNSDK